MAWHDRGGHGQEHVVAPVGALAVGRADDGDQRALQHAEAVVVPALVERSARATPWPTSASWYARDELALVGAPVVGRRGPVLRKYARSRAGRPSVIVCQSTARDRVGARSPNIRLSRR